MNCEKVREEIKAYIDNELGPISRRRVSQHLSCCPECQAEYNDILRITTEFLAVKQEPAPDGLRQKVLAGLDFKPVPRKTWSRIILTSPATWIGTVIILGTLIVVPTAMKKEQREVYSRCTAESPESKTAIPSPEYPVHKSQPASVRSNYKANKPITSGKIEVLDKKVDSRNEHIILDVDDIHTAERDIVDICKSVGGKLSGNAPEITLTIPSDTAEDVIKQLEQLGTTKKLILKAKQPQKQTPEEDQVTISIYIKQKNN